LLETIDGLAGRRGRSGFIVDATTHEVCRHLQLKASEKRR
jgi:hypothetical protein